MHVFLTSSSDVEIEQLMKRCTRQKNKLRQKRKVKSRKKCKSAKTLQQTVIKKDVKLSPEMSSFMPLEVQATHINSQSVRHVHPSVHPTLNKSLFEQSTLQYHNQQKKFLRRLPRMDSHPIIYPIEPSPARTQHTARQSWHEESSPRKSFQKGGPPGAQGRHPAEELCRVIKVFLSEKQSSTITDMGRQIPCAPPGTPMPG